MTYGGFDHDEPFEGDQFLENQEYEANANYDYYHELAAEHYDFEAEREPEDEPPWLGASGWWSWKVCACRAEKLQVSVGSPDYGPIPF